jgi:predicted nucleic acid-binding Zn ribbon protein
MLHCPHCNQFIPANEEWCRECGKVIADEAVAKRISSLKKERAFQNGMSFLFGVPGLLLSVVSGFLVASTNADGWPLALLLLLVGLVLLSVGLCFVALYKGLHPAWALLSLLSLIGCVVLALLPDEKGRRLRRLQVFLRERRAEKGAQASCPYCNEIIPVGEKRCSRCGEIIDDREVEEMIEGLKKERAFQNGMCWLFGVPGLLLGFGSAFVQFHAMERERSPDMVLIAVGLGLLGTVLLTIGLGFAAMYKGRNPAWALLGLLHLIGFIIVAVLRDEKGRRLLRLRNWLRERRAPGG